MHRLTFDPRQCRVLLLVTYKVSVTKRRLSWHKLKLKGLLVCKSFVCDVYYYNRVFYYNVLKIIC